jgi:hypothetical protein
MREKGAIDSMFNELNCSYSYTNRRASLSIVCISYIERDYLEGFIIISISFFPKLFFYIFLLDFQSFNSQQGPPLSSLSCSNTFSPAVLCRGMKTENIRLSCTKILIVGITKLLTLPQGLTCYKAIMHSEAVT